MISAAVKLLSSATLIGARVASWSDSIPQINCNVFSPNSLTVRNVIDTRAMQFNGMAFSPQLHLRGAGAVNFNGIANFNAITTEDTGFLNFHGPVTFGAATINHAATLNIFGPQNHPPGSLINVIDGCAISLPAHREGDVPVGLMLAGVGGSDRRIFELAAGMEAVIRV